MALASHARLSLRSRCGTPVRLWPRRERQASAPRAAPRAEPTRPRRAAGAYGTHPVCWAVLRVTARHRRASGRRPGGAQSRSDSKRAEAHLAMKPPPANWLAVPKPPKSAMLACVESDTNVQQLCALSGGFQTAPWRPSTSITARETRSLGLCLAMACTALELCGALEVRYASADGRAMPCATHATKMTSETAPLQPQHARACADVRTSVVGGTVHSCKIALCRTPAVGPIQTDGFAR